MKFSIVLAPIVSMAVLAHGDKAAAPPSDSKPVSFAHEGVKDVLYVAINNPKANSERAIQGVENFFKRNPAILESILNVANEPKHKKVKDEIARQAFALYSSKGGNLNIYEAGLNAIGYIYKNPDALDLIQQAGIKAMKDSPTLVDDFFASFEKLTKKDPSIVSYIKDYIIKFSHDQEYTYKKIFEIGLKSALINPEFASHLAVHALLVDKISRAKSNDSSCACKDKFEVKEPGISKETEVNNPEVGSEEPEIKAPETPEGSEVESPEVEAPSCATEGSKITKETVEVPKVEAEEPEDIEEVDTPEQPIEPEVEAEEPEIEEPGFLEEPEVVEPVVLKEPEAEEFQVPKELEIEESEVPEEPEAEESKVPEKPDTEVSKVPKEPEAEVSKAPEEVEDSKVPKDTEAEEYKSPEKSKAEKAVIPEEPKAEDSKTPEKPEVEEPVILEESKAAEEPEVEQPAVPENKVNSPQPMQFKTSIPVQPETIVEPAPVPEAIHSVAPQDLTPKNSYAVAAHPPNKPAY